MRTHATRDEVMEWIRGDERRIARSRRRAVLTTLKRFAEELLMVVVGARVELRSPVVVHHPVAPIGPLHPAEHQDEKPVRLAA